MSLVTAADIKAARMKWCGHIDYADRHETNYECDQFPELWKLVVGPRGSRSKVVASSKLYVGKVEVASNHQAIADAINAHRAAAVAK
ncbi:MAG TPA: hypothetical protein VGV37_01945 [Aliidongia sp.]|uniref:hypothetical protein n=1 Tax=Aliidongia sp. TaxID=1914230 RepID=UPI002DDCF2F7|nr:hypothetical protein [Aliidongia sp.]HEV2673273.1 hypothetical protein [Aliidongia sp.]